MSRGRSGRRGRAGADGILAAAEGDRRVGDFSWYASVDRVSLDRRERTRDGSFPSPSRSWLPFLRARARSR